MNKKYELISAENGLFRIKALCNFDDIKQGDLGGLVDNENNLSHYGNCWIYPDALVADSAHICGNTKVKDNSVVYDKAFIKGEVILQDFTVIRGNSLINGNTVLSGTTVINNSLVENSIIRNAYITNHASIENTTIKDVIIDAPIKLKNATINSLKDFLVFKNWWSSGRLFVFTKSNRMWSVGCFYGTGEELIKKAYSDSELSGREYERVVNYVNNVLLPIIDKE